MSIFDQIDSFDDYSKLVGPILKDAQQDRAEIKRLRAALTEENLTKVYTMARGHWVEAATNENMGSVISEEAYIGRWMSKYLCEQRGDNGTYADGLRQLRFARHTS